MTTENPALVKLHDAINNALDAITEHPEPTRELGQVEHKLIEAKMWLGAVPGAAEAILNDLDPGSGQEVADKLASIFPVGAPAPDVPDRSMANDPPTNPATGTPIDTDTSGGSERIAALESELAALKGTPAAPAASAAAETPQPPAPAPDLVSADHAEQPPTE